jgi:hypothetical protein
MLNPAVSNTCAFVAWVGLGARHSKTFQPVEKVGTGRGGRSDAPITAHVCTGLELLKAPIGQPDNPQWENPGVFQQAGSFVRRLVSAD